MDKPAETAMQNETSSAGKIPRILIQFWHDKRVIPPEIDSAIRKSAERNPDYEVIFADDDFMREHIAARYDREILDLYRANKLPASRSDLSRYMLLREFGGVYLDAGFELLKSLDTLMDAESDVILMRRDDFEVYAECPERAHLMGSLIGATPGNGMIEDALSTALDHLKSRKYNYDSWMAAGPYCLNLVLEKHEKLSRITKLSFSALRGDLFELRFAKGVSNSWMKEQKKGILPPID